MTDIATIDATRTGVPQHPSRQAVTVRCTGTADVVAAVNFARDREQWLSASRRGPQRRTDAWEQQSLGSSGPASGGRFRVDSVVRGQITARPSPRSLAPSRSRTTIMMTALLSDMKRLIASSGRAARLASTT